MGAVGGIGSVHSLPIRTSNDSLNLNRTESEIFNKFKAFNSAKFSTQQTGNIKKKDVQDHLKALDSASTDWSSVNNFEGNLSSLRDDYQAVSLNKFQYIENPSETLLKNTAKDLADRLEAKIEKNKKFSVKNSVRENTIKRLTKRLHNIQYLLEDFLNNPENKIIGTIGWGEHCSIQLEKKAGVSQLDGVIVKEGDVIKYYQLSTSIDVFGRLKSPIYNLTNQKDLYTIGDDDSSSVISASSDDLQSVVSIGDLGERIAPEKNKVPGQERISRRQKPKVRFNPYNRPHNRPPSKKKLHEDPPSLAHGGAQPLGNVGSAVSADIRFKYSGQNNRPSRNIFGIDLGRNSLLAPLEKVLSPSSVEGSQVSSSGDSRPSHSSSDSEGDNYLEKWGSFGRSLLGLSSNKAGSSGSASLTDTSQTSPLSDPRIDSRSKVLGQTSELNEQKQEEGGVLGLGGININFPDFWVVWQNRLVVFGKA